MCLFIFDNDAKVHAPHNAKELAAAFGLRPIAAGHS